MLSSVGLDKSYHELIDMIVCSRDSKQCMVHRCPTCPDGSALIKFLEQSLKEEEPGVDVSSDDNEEQDDTEEEETIAFHQWTTVDRSELVLKELPISEFISTLAEKLHNLTSHSFIANALF